VAQNLEKRKNTYIVAEEEGEKKTRKGWWEKTVRVWNMKKKMNA
jgi:hypothetical protein